MPLEQHQADSLTAAFALLRDHFDCCLVAVATDDCPNEINHVLWSGGYVSALGLCSMSTLVIQSVGSSNSEQERNDV